MSGVRVPCRAHANAAPMHRHMIFLYSRNANVICDISGVCILPYAQIAYIHRWPYSMMQESGPTSRHDFFFSFFLLSSVVAAGNVHCTMQTQLQPFDYTNEKTLFSFIRATVFFLHCFTLFIRWDDVNSEIVQCS